MTPELIGIITVGVALGALMFAAWKWLADRMDKQFAASEARIDRRFEQVDRRFIELEARIDQRFEEVNRRFEQVDKRFVELEARVDQRFEEVNRRFDALEGRMLALEQRSARLEGVLDGLREALFERVGR